MYEEIIEINGNNPGPTSMILAGVHGNERCGIEALGKILPNLVIENGRVFIGYGNPRAIEQNVRFTEANLNRMFKADSALTEVENGSYEYVRAQFLKKYLDQADVLLDIHASNTPGSQRFVIGEQNATEIVKQLPFSLVVSGFDQIQPGGTDYYMNGSGKVGICAECGYVDDPESTKIAEESIEAFLIACGHVNGNNEIHPQSQVQINRMYTTKSNLFQLTKEFEDFEKITAGQVIGTDGGEEIRAKDDGVILFARNRNQIGQEGFLLGE
jgi:succinylglutamate desuccinylase